MRTATLFLIIFITLFPSYATAYKYPQHPSAPEADLRERVSMVIVIKDAAQQVFKKDIAEKYKTVEINREYQEVFTGFAVEGEQGEIDQLLKEPYVLQGNPVSSYSADIDESVPFIGGEDVRGLFDEHHKRLTGKGIVIGVIDTGMDYTHRDLRSSYAGGYDFIDNDADSMETMGKGEEQTFHGTHVAGVIAANGKLRGVAPDAKIIAYRALGPGGVGTSDQIIAAIDRAIKDKVDIINLSLGNSINGPDWPTSLALNKAAEKGIVAVTSSGNSGPKSWTVGSPGTAEKAISVGASTPPGKSPFLQIGKKMLKLHPMQGAESWTLNSSEKIIEAGFGYAQDIPKSARGHVVLMKRGKIPFTEKVLNAELAGAKAVLIYNHKDGSFAGNVEIPVNLPVASLSGKDGEYLRNKVKKELVSTIYIDSTDELADFSSRGPVTNTWSIKPDLVAPGVSIHSTVPGGYLALQGTSMAAPHVAGACALLLQAHPGWTPDQVKAALMNTSKKLYRDGKAAYKPTEQGTGRMDVLKAAEADLLLYPSSLSFGQFKRNAERTKKTVSITLENTSSESQTFTFSYPKQQQGLQWQMPLPVTAKPGEKVMVNLSADVTPSLLEKGNYEGWLQVKAGDDMINIPYLFVVDEPDYPRIMGFSFQEGDMPGTYQYDVYMPGGADEMGIALYDPDTLMFKGFLDYRRNLERGLYSQELKNGNLQFAEGVYLALVYVKKDGREDVVETEILVEKPLSIGDDSVFVNNLCGQF
ncbi:S8 family serine peptidase [Bacillus lacus]|uniref:S8 family serine peptidase n=1 Tax=Metabacillus lacus TaxID=1983721 RepID=A0A7X2J294_9BACI|nr:S8 family serine peptidase [Metabacillus lacus]MRX74148.1 S8 family serine peptidase [Metabacillus lacus]